MLRPHRIYVEPFAGGAAVYFRKGASEKEVLNDKDAEIAFAFRFLSNMTPEQFRKLKRKDWIKSERRFKKLKATTPRTELEGNKIGVDHLWRVHERLRRTRVHNTTALKIIDKYDSPDTLFYLDPPYPGRAFIGRSFGEYTVNDLKELIQKLKGIRGKFVLSLGTEHQKYLPPTWRVKRLKLRRNIPSGGMGWNQGNYQFEIVAANYNFDKLVNAQRRSRLFVPVILSKGSYRVGIGPREGAEIKRTGVMGGNVLRQRGRWGRSRRQKGVYTHPSQVPGVISRRLR